MTMERTTVDTNCLEWTERESIEYVDRRLQKVFAGETLARAEARRCLLLFLERRLGEATETSFGALFGGIMSRGDPTVDEILGFMDVVLWHDRSHRYVPDVEDTVSIVGSGKDDVKTFNISTGSALTAATCGASIVKNGSRSESSVAGTTDVMEHLGVNITPSEREVEASLRTVDLTFTDAGNGFPRMGETYVGNFVFINPLSYILSIASSVEFDHIVFGLASEDLTFTADVLEELGFSGSYVVSGRDEATGGLIDELSVVGPSELVRVGEDDTQETLTPERFDVPAHAAAEIAEGDTLADNTRILVDAIDGPQAERGHGPTDAVVVNAAPAMVAGGVADTLDEAVDLAYDAIERDEVLDTLYGLVDASNGDRARLERTLSEVRS